MPAAHPAWGLHLFICPPGMRPLDLVILPQRNGFSKAGEAPREAVLSSQPLSTLHWFCCMSQRGANTCLFRQGGCSVCKQVGDENVHSYYQHNRKPLEDCPPPPPGWRREVACPLAEIFEAKEHREATDDEEITLPCRY